MSERGENSDEEYYVNEAFEEDSQSELEEQETEEEAQDEQDDEIEGEEEDNDEDTEIEVEEQFHIQKAAHLEESDTQSESDVEAEFMRGNVSPNPVQELTISQFSLTAPVPTPRPQPHARRMLAGRSSGRGFNRDRMPIYPSSSSEDESQVIVTKTVAEVNHISLEMGSGLEDETPSVRTLMPNSARDPGDDDEDTETEVEVEEIEEEEEVEEEEDDEDAQSDGSIDSNKGNEIAEESDEEEGTDVEVEQLEEDEPSYGAKIIRPKIQQPQEDIVSLVDASDNSSEYSVVTMGRAAEETDATLEDSSPRLLKVNVLSRNIKYIVLNSIVYTTN